MKPTKRMKSKGTARPMESSRPMESTHRWLGASQRAAHDLVADGEARKPRSITAATRANTFAWRSAQTGFEAVSGAQNALRNAIRPAKTHWQSRKPPGSHPGYALQLPSWAWPRRR